MVKFCIGLSIVLIFAFTANAKHVSSDSETSIYDEIESTINATELKYRNVTLGLDETFMTILETATRHALNRTDEIFTDLKEKLNEFEQVFVEIIDVTPSDCKIVTDELHQLAYDAIDTMKLCAADQLEEINDEITEIKKKIEEELDTLAEYKKNAEKCNTNNTNSNSRIRKCLKRLRNDLKNARVIDFSARMLEIEKRLENSAALLDSCALKKTDLYYERSELTVKMAKDCIKWHCDKKI